MKLCSSYIVNMRYYFISMKLVKVKKFTVSRVKKNVEK